MQNTLFGDMNFRDSGMSEDCLTLTTGGFQAGDASEPRYDAESMARKDIVSNTVNYRLGVFGFLAHPALSADSKHHASGNYGLLDQSEALRWVKANVAAFGGESAGAPSVSAQMASPLSRDLIVGAIGESGSDLSAASLNTVHLEHFHAILFWVGRP